MPYNIAKVNTDRYEFVSHGPKGAVLKAVEITPLARKDFYNLGFGDVVEDGFIDDTTETNNNDLLIVLATVVNIMLDFLATNASARLFFTGSDQQRTIVYDYILKRNYPLVVAHFKVTALVERKGNVLVVDYDPLSKEEKLGFIIEKIN